VKAAILAAGEGTRMRPLTVTRPKVMLPVANRPMLEQIIISARDAGITEFVCVVGYMGDLVRAYFGDGERMGVQIDYVEQKEQLGTAHAIGTVRELVGDRFLLLNGDAIVGSSDLRSIVSRGGDVIMAVKEVDSIEGYGVVATAGDRVVEIIEKPEQTEKTGQAGQTGRAASNLVNAGIYLFSDAIFDAIDETKKSIRGEYEITDSIQSLIDDTGAGVDVGYSTLDTWIDIGRPWNLLDANEYLLSWMGTEIAGEIEPYATLKGNVVVGAGTIIRNGSYITGPVMIGENCDIGPNCFVRPGTSLGNNVRIGNAVEIKNSIVMDKTNIGHLSYVGDSVIGSGCNFGAGTKIANLRHDGRNVRSVVKDVPVDTGRRKLGAIMGDNVHTGINTCINVGVMLDPGTGTHPGEVVMG